MNLSASQLATLRADILADPVLSQVDHTSNAGYDQIAAAYNVPAAPAFWVWRSNVTRAEVYHSTSVDGTTWDWNTYKAQSVTEQNAWTQMFMNDSVNFGLANFRAGVAAIFQGSNPQNLQRTHILTVGRRACTRGEKLLANGTGTTATPATLGLGAEGLMGAGDISAAFS